MKLKEKANLLAELVKIHMTRFDNTRKIQWTFNSFFWAGILVSGPYLKSIKYDPALSNFEFFLYGSCVITAYFIVMYLFQRSLEWDKNKFKGYREELEKIIEFKSVSDETIKWSIIWIIIQLIVTTLLILGIYLFLLT